MNLEQIDAAIAKLEDQRQLLLRAEKATEYRCAYNENSHAVVVGGDGQLGRLFVELLERSKYQVDIIEKEDWLNSAESFGKASLVLLAVPINQTINVIQQLPKLKSDCILADVTSIKQKPIKAMLEKHEGPVVGLHPMFGPDVSSFDKQTIIICHGQLSSEYQWLLDQLEIWGATLSVTSAEQHDKAMALIQVMRHFSTVVYGEHLKSEQADLAQITQLSSPIYRLELAMVGRLFAQDPELYTDIIFSDLDNVQMMKRYIGRFNELLSLVEVGDKEGFVSAFNEITAWFGDYADKFLAESAQMLSYKKN